MTNKTPMPEPVAWMHEEWDHTITDDDKNAASSTFSRYRYGLITTDQAEAYANARVKQALEEAISADGASARPVTKSASEQEGWVLVPVTPTPEMLQAGYWSGSGDVSVNQAWARKEVWARMIGSAPKPDE